ncbi:MAG: hypothetical protein CM15mP107_3000 [Bacteroidota bacterium]|nr:MAG: hypothetical protein CM15mP107_3000 [Bacteroidota bacterium]
MRILLIISLLFVVQLKAQVGLGLEYQRNVECVSLSHFEDLLLGNSSFLLTKPKAFYRLAYGLEIQEAISGQFGGFYVFGLTSEIDFKLKKIPVSFNLNGFIGGGGGSSAPDGSGLAYRYAIGLKGHLSPNFNLLARYSTYDLPTGSIAGRQVQFGFSYGYKSIFNSDINNVRIAKQSVSIQSLFVDLDTNDSERLNENYRSKFISVEYATHFTDNLEGLIRLQAAISRQIDGFMAYYSGLSYTTFKHKYIALKFRSLIGSCGGGAMNTSGGFAYLLETGIDLNLSNKTISLSKGYNASYAGTFSADYLQLGLKYHFESNLRLGTYGKKVDSYYGFKQKNIGVKTGIQVHQAPNALDRNSLIYENMTLMYFGLAHQIHNKIDILGETRWAMGGDYGAYAEGIVGLFIPIINFNKFTLSTPIQMVVAGGGGIDVGKGFGIQLNLSADYHFAKSSSLSFSVGKLNFIDGNYTPLSFNINIKQNLFLYSK